MEQLPDTFRDIGLTAGDVASIAALYNGRLATFGEDIKTVGWRSRQDQHLRFEMLFRGLSLEKASVLDVGCGLGDLAPWLAPRTGEGGRYLGLDLSADLVRAASQRHGSPCTCFVEGSLTRAEEHGRFDYVALSGTLTFRTSDNLATMRAVLAHAFGSAEKGVCCNFMSTHVDSMLEKNFHYDPRDVFAYAKTLSPWVTLYHDYPLYEFTVQILKNSIVKREVIP